MVILAMIQPHPGWPKNPIDFLQKAVRRSFSARRPYPRTISGQPDRANVVSVFRRLCYEGDVAVHSAECHNLAAFEDLGAEELLRFVRVHGSCEANIVTSGNLLVGAIGIAWRRHSR